MSDSCAPLVAGMRGGLRPNWGASNFGPVAGTPELPAMPRELTEQGHVNAEAVLMGTNTYEASPHALGLGFGLGWRLGLGKGSTRPGTRILF